MRKIFAVCTILALAAGAANAALLAEYTYGSNGLNNTGSVGAAANGTGVGGWAATADDGSAIANAGGSTGYTTYMVVGGNADGGGWLNQITNQLTISLWSNYNWGVTGAGGGSWGTFAATGKPQSDQDGGFTFQRYSSNKTIMFASPGCITGYDGLKIDGTTWLPTDGSWHHYAAIYDGTTAKIYFDGVEKGSTSASGNVNLGLYDLWIGGNPELVAEGYNPWTLRAFTDDVRIYSNALSFSELQAQVAAGRSVLVPEPTTIALLSLGALGFIRRKRA